MVRLRRARVVATLFLLALAATADAECAWVLWKKTETASTSAVPESRWSVEWEIHSAHTNRKGCDDTWKTRTLNTVQDIGRLYRYYCLPDTVDPRGPKGK